ncbi:MAG: HD domain-containing protein [Bdellovibrionales bacterium]|nr:HD domain-containing protein [Bdellovibrionales bacterium]
MTASPPGVELSLPHEIVSRADGEFVPVVASALLTRTACPHDVHLRLSSGHYVKVLRSGDILTEEQLARYAAKGVRWFHVRRAELERALSEGASLAAEVLRASPSSGPAPTAGAALESVAAHGEALASALRACGVNDAQLAEAHRFLGNVERVVKRLDLRSRESLQAFFADAAACEHGVGTAFVAALVCEAMGIEDHLAVEVVGVAALLHDIGLHRMPVEVQTEDEGRMPESLRALYRTHPAVGAELLQAAGLETAVVEIVRSHHERRDLRGFPVHFGVSRVNRLGEIVGVADDFHRLLMTGLPSPLATLEREHLPGFSRGLADALRDYFLHTLR